MRKGATSFNTSSTAGMAAVVAGILYISRWVWELWEGILKNMNSPSLVTQNFFIVKLLLILALGAIYRITDDKAARIGIGAACAGLVWTSVTRTVEAYGVSGPWGLFGSPGLLLFFTGLAIAGFRFMKRQKVIYLGKLLMYIFFFSFFGSISAILLFNLLGRDAEANQVASVVSNIFLIAEGSVWIMVGFHLNQLKFGVEHHTSFLWRKVSTGSGKNRI